MKKLLLLLPLLLVTYFCLAQDAKEIIGKPITIGNLHIAQYDFEEKMTWEKAKAKCYRLGKGWRLPTKNELNVMYKNKDRIGGFALYVYWSSTEGDFNGAWAQYFTDGFQDFNDKNFPGYVRAVRSL